MKRVVIYARVSTEHEAQISALENQIQYYDEILKRYPDWILVDRYIDEGITGTSIKKRGSFLRMMEDAKKGRFDLVITREVSRFARNIVDTLQQTRLLKTYGVEVWFTEDNIWTLNDEDGELRLSIMATLAQNESKKISQRVRAGQMISFKNGRLYGNGNILGYDRVGEQMIVNREQAETVKRIFDLYTSGHGVRAIKDIMEQECRLTSMGHSKWYSGQIAKMLKNPFYCGRIVYRKQYVEDYLTQKKVNNKGEVEKIYVQGTHEKIISEEQFDLAQQIMEAKSITIKENMKAGRGVAKIVWVKKTRCTCGHTMNRRNCYTAKNGEKSFFYTCYDQLRNGTPRARAKKGLSTEGVCDNTTFPEWKLEVQAQFIFGKLIENKDAIFNRTMEMVADLQDIKGSHSSYKMQIENNKKEIEKINSKITVLVDMCTEGDISKEVFREKKETLEKKIEKIITENELLRKRILAEEKNELIVDRANTLEEFVKMKIYDNRTRKIPTTIIDYYVDSIIYDKGIFTWILNPAQGNKLKQIEIDAKNLDKKKVNTFSLSQVLRNTGCNC